MKLPAQIWMPREAYFSDAMLVEQLERIAQLPFAMHHISLTPDGHPGEGMPIGAVLAADNAVIPSAVGTDCGCGMAALKTTLTEKPDRATLERLVELIREVIPVGFKHHSSMCDQWQMPDLSGSLQDYPVVVQEYDNARTQLGTLGGGKVVATLLS